MNIHPQSFPKRRTSSAASCALRALRIKPEPERSCRPRGKLSASHPSRGEHGWMCSPTRPENKSHARRRLQKAASQQIHRKDVGDISAPIKHLPLQSRNKKTFTQSDISSNNHLYEILTLNISRSLMILLVHFLPFILEFAFPTSFKAFSPGGAISVQLNKSAHFNLQCRQYVTNLPHDHAKPHAAP